ncbi:nitrogenase molybdenum-cofactor synthesis protein NifE [Natranaerovirga hydrolytica]|uniref:Nitrogenase molybdenum-cofactor synthesis protein NifE n=1 Tax=Natranaerovirga hydrolytica TaxID=680378 RepID=A0A4R1MTN8_9FIRM|nr:nitrogenase component 1 [Natranaerovirga hydrolytica]TCK93333.1 nitrogenase molybdenum-cofactor synthesis protein NifE [Natranaerovirga hydrolytica]
MKTIDLDNRAKHISQIKTDKKIQSCHTALYPGARCPLAVVNSVLSGIKGITTLIIGMAECTYYNKNVALTTNSDHQNHFTWSYALDSKEIIFGCKKGILKAIDEINKTGVEVIFIISACVPETIGEDFSAIASDASEKLKAKVLHIEAAHFKNYSSVPSLKDAFTILSKLMEEQAVNKKGINLLGIGAHMLINSELVSLLKNKGVEIQTIIPSTTTVSDIKKAPRAKLNIVTDLSALPLAKKMKEIFGTAYLLFPHLLDIEEIREGYRSIEDALDIDINEEVEGLYKKAKASVALHAKALEHKTFGCGYFFIDPMITSAFLKSLKMTPLYIETEYYHSESKYWKNKIIEHGIDPYIVRVWDFDTTKEVLGTNGLDFFIGLNIIKESQYKEIYVENKTAVYALGFEQPIGLLEAIVKSKGMK